MPLAVPETSAPHAVVSAGQGEQVSVLTLVFDHLGLIVSELAEGRAFLAGTLGISQWSEVIDDDGLGVAVQFGAAPNGVGPTYELVAPRGKYSPIAGQLGRGKGVLNHLAYRTADLQSSAAHLRTMGCFAASEPKPARAYDGALVQFWVSPLRFLIELIAKPDHTHVLTAMPSERQPGR